jgi:hypothetical protein
MPLRREVIAAGMNERWLCACAIGSPLAMTWTLTTFDLLYRREANQPNDIRQADHTLLDLWVRHDGGPPVRPWLTVIMDDYSRAIAGFGLSVQAPSAIHTALLLRQAIWRKPLPQWSVCGIPLTFYTDHGSDFTSHHLEQVSADLKMELVFSEAGMPRGRGRAAIIRVTGGNCRLLHRLLTQIARLMEINAVHTITRHIVEAARESLVIGMA